MAPFVRFCTRTLEAFAATILFVLTIMVFINVVLRYGFNSSITITEELGRYLFVWLVFAGAILAAGSDTHVRVDLLTRLLPRMPRDVLAIICDAIMIYCCYLIVVGGFQLSLLNMDNRLAISRLPVGWLYMAGFLCGLCIGLILIVRMIGRIIDLARTPAVAQEG
ncbi:MAG: TRAP transporter small permease [Planctomycetes bacterium]|nr:TRAP transporter small permease [Planctomycetota bacterium]